MKFLEACEEAVFLKRYKRFFADLDCKGTVMTAHVPNTGSLKGCLGEGSACRISLSKDPARKLKATLQMIQTPTSWVGVNTSLSNGLVWEAFENRVLPAWEDYEAGQREVKINEKSRIDLVLWRRFEGPPEGTKLNPKNLKDFRLHFVEVKNVTLAEGRTALFPDAVTERGQKHLEELMRLSQKGHSAEILFTVQRTDCEEFRPADMIDPRYGKLLRKAAREGVKISAFPCRLDHLEISLETRKPLKVVLE
jgi:sugar fermentation stimulation protein A